MSMDVYSRDILLANPQVQNQPVPKGPLGMTSRTSRIPGENSQLLQAIHDRLNDAAWIDKASSPMVEFKSLWLHDVREIWEAEIQIIAQLIWRCIE